MKPVLTRLAICSALVFGGNSAHAGIPVIDVASLTQAVMEVMHSVEQITNQIQQIRQLEQQLTEIQTQTRSLTGARNLGSILNSPLLQNYIPANATDTMSSIYSSGYSGLSSSAKGLRDATMVYNCLDVEAGAKRTRCQAELGMPYQEKAFLQDAMQSSQGRMAQIQSLMRRLDTTADQKEATEIVGRIEAENAMLQHEQTQISLALGVAESNARIAQSRAREAQLQNASRTGRLADFIAR